MISDTGIHITVPESKAEKNATRELASRGAQATELAVAFPPGSTLGD